MLIQIDFGLVVLKIYTPHNHRMTKYSQTHPPLLAMQCYVYPRYSIKIEYVDIKAHYFISKLKMRGCVTACVT